MLKLLLLTAGTWTAISFLFTWRLAAAFRFFASDGDPGSSGRFCVIESYPDDRLAYSPDESGNARGVTRITAAT